MVQIATRATCASPVNSTFDQCVMRSKSQHLSALCNVCFATGRTHTARHLRVLACGWSGAGQLMILTWPGFTACLTSTWRTARTAAVS